MNFQRGHKVMGTCGPNLGEFWVLKIGWPCAAAMGNPKVLWLVKLDPGDVTELELM